MVSLSLDPPPTREGHTPGRAGRVAVLFVVLAVAAAAFMAGRWTAPGGRYAVTLSRDGMASTAPVRPSAPQPATAAGTAAAPVAPRSPAQTAVPALAAATQPAAAPAALAPPPAPAPAVPPGPRRLVITLQGPLEEAIGAGMPASDRGSAGELTQVVNRLLVWNLQVARDGRKGDRLEVVYSPAAGGTEPGAAEPVVQALRYDSQKLAVVLAAYRFQAPGARWYRYYRPDGSELEERLVDSPTPDYDQITSLLRDGRGHKGVDFRTPVGSPVFATFDGVIERRNWNFAGNGNCLDVRDLATGRHTILLHLDLLPKDMVAGRRVKKGERIASSGNSGHSFAPHLHYQLEAADGRVLDPFAVQPVHRISLDGPAKAAFDAERARLDAALSGTAVASAGK